MRKLLLLLGSLVLALTFLVASEKTTLAAEGTYELRSTNSNKYRCFAASIQAQNLTYVVTVSCRDLLYPADDTIFAYILWANPDDGSKPVKLGPLNFGRAQFNVKTSFSSLFVTTEPNAGTNTPSGAVVMKGSIIPLTFLERPSSPSPTSAQGGPAEGQPTPTPKPNLRDRLLLGLRRAGLASALALVAILGLVFVLTRPRG